MCPPASAEAPPGVEELTCQSPETFDSIDSITSVMIIEYDCYGEMHVTTPEGGPFDDGDIISYVSISETEHLIPVELRVMLHANGTRNGTDTLLTNMITFKYSNECGTKFDLDGEFGLVTIVSDFLYPHPPTFLSRSDV